MTLLHPPTSETPFAAQDSMVDGMVLDQEADHRIANNLGLIIGLLRMRSRAVVQGSGRMDRQEVGELLEDIAARVEAVARLHRMLSQSYRHALVDLSGYLRELCTSLTTSLSAHAHVVCTHETDASCVLPPDQVLTVGLLVSELVTNSVKHAHPTGLPVKMEIRCGHTATGNLVIDIADDGIGLPENFDPTVDGGLGLRVVRSLAAQLRATIAFQSSSLGTNVRIELPADAAR